MVTTVSGFLYWLPVGLDCFGPVMVLLLVKRRGASWPRAFKMCALSATVGAFLVTGTFCALAGVLNGTLFAPQTFFHASPFIFGGAIGVAYALMALALALPILGAWFSI